MKARTSVVSLCLLGLFGSSATSGCASSLRGEEPNESAGAAPATLSARAPSARGLYVGVCGFSLVAYDPVYAIRFYAETSFTPTNGSGGDGTLTVSLTTLTGWDPVADAPRPPSAIRQDATVGQPIVATSDVTNRAFVARYPELDILPLANSISGSNARVERIALEGTFEGGAARFCTGLAGMLTAPIEYELTREENTCLFVKVDEGAPLPKLDASEFHCP
jgi:hypothetical protein